MGCSPLCLRAVGVYLGVLALLWLSAAAPDSEPAAADPPGTGAGGALLTYAAGRDALALLRAPPGIAERVPTRLRGEHLLAADWLAEPPVPDAFGPHFDEAGCFACHVEGLPRAQALGHTPPPVARLLHPADIARSGGQINRHAVVGAPQGRVLVHWQTHELRFSDGTPVLLRAPRIAVADAAEAPLGPVTLRMPPALFGWGLLEAVPDAFLHNFADPEDADGNGISGRVSLVQDRTRGRQAVGRFGWKAEQPSLRQQTAAALCNDMGITTPVFTGADCPGQQAAVEPELGDAALEQLVEAQRYLGVPDRHGRETPQTIPGRVLFDELGCGACHLPVMLTGPADAPALADQVIWPYSDLLLHDMGEGLADPAMGPDDALAREWRTAPLWGIGRMAERFPERGFLHDGRARTLLEAILWHGGEAAPVRERVLRLQRDERAALLVFLRSL
jgi:CxxC motif-containing protein (DUF1111 family)